MDFHMNCGLAFITDKLVGMHVSSVSNFGDKSKAENRTNKPHPALKGHYGLIIPISPI
jgi:hypothetical protein